MWGLLQIYGAIGGRFCGILKYPQRSRCFCGGLFIRLYLVISKLHKRKTTGHVNCNSYEDVESISHVLFACKAVKDIWKKERF